MTVESTLFRLAFRQFTASRRALWVLALAAIPVVLALITRAQAPGAAEAMEELVDQYAFLIVRVLLPLVALVVGTSVFGAETEDGTILYVLGKPVERWRMLLARLAAAAAATAAVMVPTTLAAGLITLGGFDAGGLVLATTVSVAVGGLLYCVLFITLSLATRRALVAGLAYVVIWEGALSGSFAGTRALSVREYTLTLGDALSTVPDAVFAAQLGATTALVMATGVAVAALLYAVRKLRTFEIGEAA